MLEIIPQEFKTGPSYLRWQVRLHRYRSGVYPLYESPDKQCLKIRGYGDAKQFNDENPTQEFPAVDKVGYWELLGFGSTWEKASKMARARLGA